MNQLIKLITHNIQYKGTALLMALVIWYIIQGEENLSINRRIYFNLRIPKGYLVKGSPSRSKEATLSGPRNVIAELSPEPLQADLVVPKGVIGDVRIDIDPTLIKNINPKIKITITEPFFNVLIDKRLSRTVPIRESLVGQPKEGYVIDKIELEPRSVQLSGLSSEIASLKEILTEPIDIQDLDRSQTYETPLLIEDIQSTKPAIDHVYVKILISEQKATKRFSEIPITLEGTDNLHPGLEKILQPQTINVAISAAALRLSSIKRADIKAFVTLSAEDALPSEKKVQIQLPENTSLIEVAPPTCAVLLKPIKQDGLSHEPKKKRGQ